MVWTTKVLHLNNSLQDFMYSHPAGNDLNMKILRDCLSFPSSWGLVSIRRGESRGAEVMWFHLQSLLLRLPHQPFAELAPMMLFSQTIFKKGFTETLHNLKQTPSFHLRVLWPDLLIWNPSELIYAKTYNLKTEYIWFLLLPSLAKAVILPTHKSTIHDKCAQARMRDAVIYVFCISVPC